MVCLHGFTDTWRTWELVLPALEREHQVLAPALPGHAGGPPIEGPVTATTMADGVERIMDDAGLQTAHLVGNSLGGHVALQLAARGRARTVVALAPAGGWARGAAFADEMLDRFTGMVEAMRAAAPQAPAFVATLEGRRRATEVSCVRFEHIPAELIAHQMLGVAACRRADDLITAARRLDWDLDAAAFTCPVRVVWGTEDRLLPWPDAAQRYLREWLPHADWVVLDDVGHAPQLDVPTETAALITGFTGGGAGHP